MFSYFNLFTSYIHGGTILLYTFLFVFSSCFAFLAQPSRYRNTTKIKRFWYTMSFLLLWFFYALNNVGVDTEHYHGLYDMYSSIKDLEIGGRGIELGFQLMSVVLHFFTNDPYIGVAIMRSFQLFFIFWGIYLLRDKIKVGYAIMMYVALFYFDAFNLLRSSMAGSLCFLSFAYMMKHKTFLPVILSVLAVFIHKTAMFYIVCQVLFYVLNSKLIRKNVKIITMTLVVVSIFVMLYGTKLLEILVLSEGVGEGRYDIYFDRKSTTGFFILVKYLVIFVLLLSIRQKLIKKDKRIWFLFIVWLACGFALAIVAYDIGILGRAAIYFASSFVVLLPYFINNKKELLGRFYRKNGIFNGKLIGFICTWYTIFLFIITLGDLYYISELGPFKFLWS